MLLTVLVSGGLAQDATDTEAPPTSTGIHADVTKVFAVRNATQELQRLCEPILLTTQTFAVLFIVGGVLAKLRQDDAQLEGIANMMLKVGMIACLSWFQPRLVETADLLADAFGNRSIPSAKLDLAQDASAQEMTPLQRKLVALGDHWRLSSSPALDVLDEQQPIKQGSEEAWLGRSWNWARRPPLDMGSSREDAWVAAAGAQRAGTLSWLILGVGSAVHLSEISLLLAELARTLLFHAGFCFLPLFIAGLGSSFHASSCRAMAGLVGVAFWPAAWAVANVGTIAMVDPTLSLLRKTASAAMYPKLADDASRTVAMAAPYLSWSLLTMLGMITLVVCLWTVATLVLAPLLLQRALSAGAGFCGSSR